MRVRIELLDVLCRDSEDVTGADTLYLAGGVSDGRQLRPVLTSRLWISSKQTRVFYPEQRVIFDAEVPAGGMVHIGLQAYDEDAAKDWAKHGEWITKLANEIAGQLEQLPSQSVLPPGAGMPQDSSTGEPDPAQVVAAILRGTVAVVGFFARLDKDDFLGTLAADIPVGVPGSQIKEWHCTGRRYGGVFGWSTWNYTIRYRVTQLGEGTSRMTATYGSTIKLLHLETTRNLHSHSHNYGHSGTSGQQQVTAFEGADDNDWWVVKVPHGQPDGSRAGQPVRDGDIIRLEHALTRRNLHSHHGIPSPVTRQQEVTCYGNNGIGDDNDNWRVEIEGGGSLDSNKRVRLIHVNTNYALHSHFGHSHPQWTMNQQEVTCFGGRDNNDWWSLSEIR